jgi:hypothetical protein
MDHQQEHQQHHQHERQHQKAVRTRHEHEQERRFRTIHPTWFLGRGVVLVTMVVLFWALL